MAVVNPVFDASVEGDSNEKIESVPEHVESKTFQSEVKIIKENNLIHGVNDIPEWYNCILYGIQHYLVAIGSVISVPLLLAESLCMSDTEDGYVGMALVIGTVFFVSGICTLLQSTLGIRLPLVQGSTFAFLAPTFAILNLPHNQCPAPLNLTLTNGTLLYNDTDGSIVDGKELWQRRMREVQGAIIVASILEFILGLTGAIGFLLKFIGPLTIAPAIALVGLDLFSAASSYASTHWGISAMTSGLLIIFSQYLKNIPLPFFWFTKKKKCHVSKTYIFRMFPILIGLVMSWIFCVILTETDVFPSDPSIVGYKARSDVKSNVLQNSPWFRFPYPGQWGLPVVRSAGAVGMLSGVIAGMIESIGDYYACAKISGAPVPPKHAINRGILAEGFGCILAGCIGSGGGSTTYSENIGAIGITRVGSRYVIQVAGIIFILLGMLPKFGAIFVTIPDPIVGGLFCVMFGIVSSVGISNLQYVDMNSSRNIFIFGFSLIMGLAVAQWMKANPGVIQTGISELDQIFTVLLSTSMFIGGFLGMFFDNTIPGTDKERGLLAWGETKAILSDGEVNMKEEEKLKSDMYNLPFPTTFRYARYFPFLPQYSVKSVCRKSSNKGV